MRRYSIITITNNDPAGFEKTHQSIQNQSFHDYEWIVVHGGGDKSTLDLIKENSRVITWYASGQDHGIYDAMNLGTDQAKGDYLIYMNGGDCFADPDILKTVDDHAKANKDPDYIYGDGYEIKEGKRILKKAYGPQHIEYAPPAIHQATFYKRTAVNDLRYDTRYKLSADYDFQARFLQKAKNMSYIDTPICLFNLDGVSAKNRMSSIKESFQVRRDTLGVDFITNAMHMTKQIGAHALLMTAPKLHETLRKNLLSIK